MCSISQLLLLISSYNTFVTLSNIEVETSESFIIGSETLNFTNSVKYCKSLGSNLASIHSSYDNLQAQSLCNETIIGCWIGLNLNNNITSSKGLIWQWEDKTVTDYGFINKSNKTNPWSVDEANSNNNNNGNCVYLDYEWVTDNCSNQYYPLCNYPSEACISGSNVRPIINGIYTYYAWNDEYNGPIYRMYNGYSRSGNYLYPWIDSYGQRYYVQSNQFISFTFSSTVIRSMCFIPSTSNPMNPYDCYYNDSQLASYPNGGYYGPLWQDTNAKLFSCTVSEMLPSINDYKDDDGSIVFGVFVLDSVSATVSHTVTLTLYWEWSIYQCNIFPSQYGRYYLCDTSNNQTTINCSTNPIKAPVQYGLQIDNEDADNLRIDSVVIKVNDTVFYIEYFCFNYSFSTSDNCLTANYQKHDYISVTWRETHPHQSQIIIIDPQSTTNESLIEPVQYNDTHFSFVCTPVNSVTCGDVIFSDYYGQTSFHDGIVSYDVNQGRINYISGWGIQREDNNSIGIAGLRWRGDDQTTYNDDYGYASGSWMDLCDTFMINDDDYIHGYNIRYTNNSICGLTFYTKNGRNLSCLLESYDVIKSDIKQSGDIIYFNKYLSGFHVVSWLIIHGMAFQFTSINGTDNCNVVISIINTTTITSEDQSTKNNNNNMRIVIPIIVCGILLIICVLTLLILKCKNKKEAIILAYTHGQETSMDVVDSPETEFGALNGNENDDLL